MKRRIATASLGRSVPNVVFAAISDTEMAAKAMGALGGAKKSAKKKKSSAANGKLGGRPKKAVLK
jgi:hypothetical protein